MGAKNHQKTKGSTKAEVGEIDTSAPFQSVKAAVSLFGEGAFSGGKPTIKKPKPQSAERSLVREKQVHLARKDLNKLKEQLENAENTKAQALFELEKAKWAVEHLNEKLKNINESKDLPIRASVAMNQASRFSGGDGDNLKGSNGSLYKDIETSKVQYTTVVTQVNVAKQELRKICLEYASAEANEMDPKQAAEAESISKPNVGSGDELSKEIVSLQDSVQQVNLASAQVVEEGTKIRNDKDRQKQIHKARLSESAQNLLALKKGTDPEMMKNPEARLDETLSKTGAMRNELDNSTATDLDSVKTVTLELDGAKESLNKTVEEKRLLRSLVESLKLELESLMKEHSEVQRKELETKSIASNLQADLEKLKFELEKALAVKAKARAVSDDTAASVLHLASESEIAKHEAEELKSKADATRIELEEAEDKLRVAMDEAEEAKAAELRALNQIMALSEKTDVVHASAYQPGALITISRDEFESLSRKVEEYEKVADMKTEATIPLIEAVKAAENEDLKGLEATQKEIEDIKAATQEALKRSKTAEAAKRMVEGELRRWEQKKAAATASGILQETEEPFQSSLQIYQILQQRSQLEKVTETRKLQKVKTSVSKKALVPNLITVFRKKNRVKGGSPSHLPSKKPLCAGHVSGDPNIAANMISFGQTDGDAATRKQEIGTHIQDASSRRKQEGESADCEVAHGRKNHAWVP